MAAAVRQTDPSDEQSPTDTVHKFELWHGVVEAIAKQLKKNEARADKQVYDR